VTDHAHRFVRVGELTRLQDDGYVYVSSWLTGAVRWVLTYQRSTFPPNALTNTESAWSIDPSVRVANDFDRPIEWKSRRWLFVDRLVSFVRDDVTVQFFGDLP
jgi:hypothetical protein